MTTKIETDGTERCKRCKEPIEGAVIMLHGKFPMHKQCYLWTVDPTTENKEESE